MNFINDSTLGSRLGTSLGSGISKTLDMLSSHKLNQLAERHQLLNNQRGLEALNVNPELAYLPQQLQGLAVKSKLGEGQQQNLANILGGLLGGEKKDLSQSLASLNPSDQFRAVQQIVQNQENAKKDEDRAIRRQLLEQKTATDIASKQIGTQIKQETADIKRISEQEKRSRENEKLALAQQKEILKQNKPFNTYLDTQLSKVDQLDKKIKRAKQLIASGNAGSRLSGYLPTGILGKGSQELESLSNDIIGLLAPPGATDLVRRQLESAKISLKQGRPAQMAAADRLDDMVKLVKAQDKIRNKIIKENGGKQPENLASMVSQELSRNPKFIELQEDVKKNIDKERILEQPIGSVFQGPNGQWYTRVKYGSGLRPATPEEIRNKNV